ncbi:hypothetical protein RSOLAG1IB_08477 [Rhizoctonia solani AG-1 IB]|uniref:Uncharacterized protein n=1 Tax=Thanatephorus cucumeris (strain AG1-IB / isolate 7/3/14) TaxID=1108050 RepID=A0A0B7FHY5_THACB|nr:hypothetical protein RSOLAG1IB_08477 [Rhizoctonia solani AG-1 IB]
MNPSSAGGRWGALMASRAYKQLMKLEADKSVVDVVHTKIDELRDGQFTMDNYSVIIGTADAIPIYRARMSNDLRIIYQVDIVPERSLQFDHQILKILCIDSRAHIDYNFWARVSSSLYQRPFGGEYKDRCIFRLPKDTTNNFIYLPAKYPHDDAMFTTEPVYLPDNYYEGSEDQTKGRADPHALGAVKAASEAGYERYIPVNKALYNSVRANVEVNLPILLDPLERAIVHNKSASIVIGRSGTGKTTALVYKMRAIHLQDQESTIRQMVVTRSRVLAKHIEATFRSLIESASIANKTSSELSIMAEQYKERVDPAVIEFDNELDLREDLPPQFSLLEDSHFPLFISFDKLCSLLEGDLLEHEQKERGYQMSIRCDNIVDFKVFQFEYWPKFKSNLKLGLDPASVYSEIMGVIKGSSNAMKSPDGFLSRNEYLVGTTRKALCQPDAGPRTQTHNTPEHHKKTKGERSERDPADRQVMLPIKQAVSQALIFQDSSAVESCYR